MVRFCCNWLILHMPFFESHSPVEGQHLFFLFSDPPSCCFGAPPNPRFLKEPIEGNVSFPVHGLICGVVVFLRLFSGLFEVCQGERCSADVHPPVQGTIPPYLVSSTVPPATSTPVRPLPPLSFLIH